MMRVDMIRDLLDRKSYGEALDAIAGRLDETPGDPVIVTLRCRALRLAGRSEEASEFASRSLRDHGDHVPLLLEASHAQRAAGDLKTSRDLCLAAVSHARKNRGAWLVLIDTETAMGDHAAALRSTNEALTELPGDPALTTRKCRFLRESGQIAAALEAADSCAETAKGYRPLAMERARLLRLSGQDAACLTLLEALSRDEPLTQPHERLRIEAAISAGESDRAVVALNAAVPRFSEDVSFQSYAARMYLLLGLPDRGSACIIGVEARHGVTSDTLALEIQLLFAQGRLADAADRLISDVPHVGLDNARAGLMLTLAGLLRHDDRSSALEKALIDASETSQVMPVLIDHLLRSRKPDTARQISHHWRDRLGETAEVRAVLARLQTVSATEEVTVSRLPAPGAFVQPSATLQRPPAYPEGLAPMMIRRLVVARSWLHPGEEGLRNWIGEVLDADAAWRGAWDDYRAGRDPSVRYRPLLNTPDIGPLTAAAATRGSALVFGTHLGVPAGGQLVAEHLPKLLIVGAEGSGGALKQHGIGQVAVTPSGMSTARSLLRSLSNGNILAFTVDGHRNALSSSNDAAVIKGSIFGHPVRLAAMGPRLAYRHALPLFWLQPAWHGDRIEIELQRFPDAVAGETEADWLASWADGYLGLMHRLMLRSPRNLNLQHIFWDCLPMRPRD